VVFDVRTEFPHTAIPTETPINVSDADKCYQPVNYDSIYRGPITMREALAQSINVPAIKFLYLAGLRDSLQVAEDMGITTLTDPNRYGLTLVLGGGEVTLLDITSAYGTFANGGVRNTPYVVETVFDNTGTTMEQHTVSPVPVLPKKYCSPDFRHPFRQQSPRSGIW